MSIKKEINCPIELETPKIKEFYQEYSNDLKPYKSSNDLVNLIITSQRKQDNHQQIDLFQQFLPEQNRKTGIIRDFLQPEVQNFKMDFFYYHSKSKNIENEKAQSQSEKAIKMKSKKIIQKRKRKSYMQVRILQRDYSEDQEWTKQQIIEMSNKTGLSESQVYKWCWDQKKKNQEEKPYSNQDTLQKTETKISKGDFQMDNQVTPRKKLIFD